jgi:hypothetical protein
LQEELARARARLQAKPGLDDCAKATKEKADLELCQAAQSALTALAAEPATTPELALKRLAPAALALARLSQRVRYLSLSELGERRVEGAAPAPSASVGGTTAPARPTHVAKGKGSSHGEQRAFELGDGPVSQLLGLAIRSERDVLRNIGAYLEYGPLSVRRAAFDTTKRLRAEHPAWPALDHLLQEAAVLESNADLKGDLQRLSATASGSPRVARPDQSAGTK